MSGTVWVLGLALWAAVIAAAELLSRRNPAASADPAELAEAEPAGPVVWTDAQLDRLMAELQRHPWPGEG